MISIILWSLFVGFEKEYVSYWVKFPGEAPTEICLFLFPSRSFCCNLFNKEDETLWWIAYLENKGLLPLNSTEEAQDGYRVWHHLLTAHDRTRAGYARWYSLSFFIKNAVPDLIPVAQFLDKFLRRMFWPNYSYG